jgi:hypothetical protein
VWPPKFKNNEREDRPTMSSELKSIEVASCEQAVILLRGAGMGIVLGAAAADWIHFTVLAFIGVVIAYIGAPMFGYFVANRRAKAE